MHHLPADRCAPHFVVQGLMADPRSLDRGQYCLVRGSCHAMPPTRLYSWRRAAQTSVCFSSPVLFSSPRPPSSYLMQQRKSDVHSIFGTENKSFAHGVFWTAAWKWGLHDSIVA